MSFVNSESMWVFVNILNWLVMKMSRLGRQLTLHTLWAMNPSPYMSPHRIKINGEISQSEWLFIIQYLWDEEDSLKKCLALVSLWPHRPPWHRLAKFLQESCRWFFLKRKQQSYYPKQGNKYILIYTLVHRPMHTVQAC